MQIENITLDQMADLLAANKTIHTETHAGLTTTVLDGIIIIQGISDGAVKVIQ